MGKALFCLEFTRGKKETKNLQDFFQKMYVLKPTPHLFDFLQNNQIINSMATWTIAVHDFQTPICTAEQIKFNSLREIFFANVKISCKQLLAFMSFWKNPMWHKQSCTFSEQTRNCFSIGSRGATELWTPNTMTELQFKWSTSQAKIFLLKMTLWFIFLMNILTQLFFNDFLFTNSVWTQVT